jgi:hypothetical protein
MLRNVLMSLALALAALPTNDPNDPDAPIALPFDVLFDPAPARSISVAPPVKLGETGGTLVLQAGSASGGNGAGGTLDLIAGNGTGTGRSGSIGIGRGEGGATSITVGRLNDPVPTEKTFVRARQVHLDAREDVNLAGKEIRIAAGPTISSDKVGGEAIMVTLPTGSVFQAETNFTNFDFQGTTQIQAYKGGLIVQKSATGKLAFYDGVPVARPTVRGSRADCAAVSKSLLDALSALHLINDATSP